MTPTHDTPARSTSLFLCLLLGAAPLAHAASLPDGVPAGMPAGVPTIAPRAELSAEGAWPVSGSLTLSSQYVTRGFRQTDGGPAAQGRFEVARASGWMAGTAVSNVSGHVVENGSVEWDVYGGYRAGSGPLGWSALLVNTRYPGATARPDGARYDYTEVVAGASWLALFARYHYTVSRDYFGISGARGSGYLDVGAHQPLGHQLTLDLHAGDGHVAGAGNDGWDWRDVKAGLTRRLEDHWLLSLNYTRALGANGALDRSALDAPRAGGRTLASTLARRAVVLSVSRQF